MSVLNVVGILCGVLFLSSLSSAEEKADMCSKTNFDSAAQEVKEKLETLYDRADNETDAAMAENAVFFETTAQSLEEAKKTCPDQNTTTLANVLRRLKQCAQSFSKRGKEGCSAKCQALDDQSQFNYVIRQKVVDSASFEQAIKCARAFSSAEQKARLYRALSLDASKFTIEKSQILFNTVKEALSAGKVAFNDKDKNVMKSALKTIVAKSNLNAPENETCACMIRQLAEYDNKLAAEALVELAQEYNKSRKYDEAIALFAHSSCLHLQIRGYTALLEVLEHAEDADQVKLALVYPLYLGMSTPFYSTLDEDLRMKSDKFYSELPEAPKNILKKAETCIPYDHFVKTLNDTKDVTNSSLVFLRSEERDYSNMREYKFVPKTDGKIMQIKHKGALGGYLFLPSDLKMSDVDTVFAQGEKTIGDWEVAADGYYCEINENDVQRPICMAPSEDIAKVNQSELLDELKDKYIKEYTDKRLEKCPQ